MTTFQGIPFLPSVKSRFLAAPSQCLVLRTVGALETAKRSEDPRGAREWHTSHPRQRRLVLPWIVAMFVQILHNGLAAESSSLAKLAPLLQKNCFECHDATVSRGGVNLEQATATSDVARDFTIWERAARMVQEGKMPPEKREPLSPGDRAQVVDSVRTTLDAYIAKHAGDPGPVALRRLTSAEYDFAIEDLTGLSLSLGKTFVNDAVGGEGFSNVGNVQFMEDSGLERYLEAAKTVADHAVIGSGPIRFFPDRGLTGLELSAMDRIQKIYRSNGFRTTAGEGAEPYGLTHYPNAFYAAWRYLHRTALGIGDADLRRLARELHVPGPFVEHIWKVLNLPTPPFPMARFNDAWRALPAPSSPGFQGDEQVRSGCRQIHDELDAWQTALARPIGINEEATVMTADFIHITNRAPVRLQWTLSSSNAPAMARLQLDSVLGDSRGQMFVIIRELLDLLTPETTNHFTFGRHPRGEIVPPTSLVIHGTEPIVLSFKVPPGATNLSLQLNLELDSRHSEDRIVRCRATIDTATGPVTRLALLAPDKSPLLATIADQLVAFAGALPQVSHREPAPSDRDPIPAPYDNKYESPDRNYFHYKVKYHRDDRFLAERILDDRTRHDLDVAWADLLGAFDYHDLKLRFLNRKFGESKDVGTTSELTPEQIAQFPETARSDVAALVAERKAVMAAHRSAEPGHIEDVLALAQRAWRKPIAAEESARLRRFYSDLRSPSGNALSHVAAVRALIARVLTAPAFLYRFEPQSLGSEAGPGRMALSDEALSSRLSFFLWASIPDDELRRAARAGELREAAGLAAQAQRLLRDPKARRLATEFFGQWYGFYGFERHDGVDRTRFPEFTESLRRSLYQEVVAFFEHIIEGNGPMDDILFTQDVFLNDELARHYGLRTPNPLGSEIARVRGEDGRARRGLLGLGAILTVTSPPLRTSPVKRGDWVLRRVLGTPPPPPPADAGSIADDDVADDGLSARERLAQHSRQPSCAHCHSRFDPFGFALEHFDPIGRWRDAYRDGREIESFGTLQDGTTIRGFSGLEDYLRQHRRLFHRTLSAKLLGYALGRNELLSDRPLIDAMVEDCASGGGFAQMALRIVRSPQFRYQRVAPIADANSSKP
ncbi:MAG: DUF1592 domain-containing protein [Verrucomicrobia bacterium]|nr:DUF1592 domain-containing protein [Verrucomicrobiota bacterium]